MQTCFFALTDLLPMERAIAAIEAAAAKSYGARHLDLLPRNVEAVRRALDSLAEMPVPADSADEDDEARAAEPAAAAALRAGRDAAATEATAAFVERVTSMMLAGKGDLLPVSALPVDGTFPTGTGRFEKRSIADEIPIWDADLCIECGLCALVCPHAAIRMKAFPAAALAGAGAALPSRPWHGRELLGTEGEDWRMTIQVFPDDCTGCAVCVDVCPAKSKDDPGHRAIDMEAKAPHLDRERGNLADFLRLPELSRSRVKADTVKGSQLLEPLFEASGACAGCGETPYLKLLSQLFGERLLVANATGCSSIFGGSLPTTPWSPNAQGRGPAWANSLFEDNAEFGLGMRLAIDQREAMARQRLVELRDAVGAELADSILACPQVNDTEIEAQRARVAELQRRCATLGTAAAAALGQSASSLERHSVWIIGGDGWAYDIGFGGVDHVLSSGRDVNLLVLDTEVYSNTGGQSSKATPRGAVAKFASSGKPGRKKDLGLIAMGYGNVYVAQIAMGANPLQTLRALREAEAYPGPSLVIAYSHCIAHGIDMAHSMHHQRDAVDCGYWPLYRFDPRVVGDGSHPFHLDSRAPTHPFQEFAMDEGRFSALAGSDPERAKRLFELAQADIDERRRRQERMAGLRPT
jgi:pyruvate-ferredoxin/flavodoxin oxidoreductase